MQIATPGLAVILNVPEDEVLLRLPPTLTLPANELPAKTFQFLPSDSTTTKSYLLDSTSVVASSMVWLEVVAKVIAFVDESIFLMSKILPAILDALGSVKVSLVLVE